MRITLALATLQIVSVSPSVVEPLIALSIVYVAVENVLGGEHTGRRTALVVGTEGEGLPQALLERLDAVRIEQASGLDSLNVATAAAIALHSVALAQGRL